MDQRTIEFSSVIPTNESLTEFGRIDRREGIHPSVFLSKTPRGKTERPFCPELEAKARAFQWALNRLSGWHLPGKEHVEDYLRELPGKILLTFLQDLIYIRSKLKLLCPFR
jgi:hypothetical protein